MNNREKSRDKPKKPETSVTKDVQRRYIWDEEQNKFVNQPKDADLTSKRKEEMRTIRALNLDHNHRHPKYGKIGTIDNSQHDRGERHISKMRERLNDLQRKECLTTGDHWKVKMANIDLKNKARWEKEKKIQAQ